MENLFPIPTSYETKDNSFFNLSYNIVLSTKKDKKVTEKQLKEIKKINIFLSSEIILLNFLMSIIFKLLSLSIKHFIRKKKDIFLIMSKKY